MFLNNLGLGYQFAAAGAAVYPKPGTGMRPRIADRLVHRGCAPVTVRETLIGVPPREYYQPARHPAPDQPGPQPARACAVKSASRLRKRRRFRAVPGRGEQGADDCRWPPAALATIPPSSGGTLPLSLRGIKARSVRRSPPNEAGGANVACAPRQAAAEAAVHGFAQTRLAQSLVAAASSAGSADSARNPPTGSSVFRCQSIVLPCAKPSPTRSANNCQRA